MKADWNDAPLRMRRRTSHKPLIVALVTITGVAATALAVKNMTWQVDRLAKAALPTVAPPAKIELPTITAPEIKQTAEAAKDIYLEQVNNMLGIGTEWFLCEGFKNAEGALAEGISQQNCKPEPIAELDWVDPRGNESGERQTVFTDANYTPATTVNTIRMPRPQPQTAQRQQPYVTVVKETKMSCWPFKEGSRECRQHKAKMHQIWRRSCDTEGNSQPHACRQAKRYDLR